MGSEDGYSLCHFLRKIRIKIRCHKRENETGKLKRTEKRIKRSGKCEEKGKREAGEVGGRQAKEQQSTHQIMNLPLVFSPSRLYLWKKEERRG